MLQLAVCMTTPEVRGTIPVALLEGSFAEKLEHAARIGCDGVELMVARPMELNAPEMREQILARGLQVAAVGSGAVAATEKLTLLAKDQETGQRAVLRLMELIDFAAAVGAPLVTIGSFRGRLEWASTDDARKRLIETLRAAAAHAQANDVRLVIEPLNRYETDLIQNAAEGLEFLNEVSHASLGLLLDTFHMNIEEPTFEHTVWAVNAVGKLWHIHIGDSNRLPPGKGHIDFGGIVAILQAIGYEGWLSGELYPRPTPNLAATDTIQYLRRFFQQAKQEIKDVS